MDEGVSLAVLVEKPTDDGRDSVLLRSEVSR